MATKKEAQRRAVLQVSALAVVAAVIVAVIVLVSGVLNNRELQHPSEVSITVTAGDKTMEIYPYMACEINEVCEEEEIPTIDVSDADTLSIEVPRSIYDHDWSLLSIYDQEAANDEVLYGPNENNTVDIPVAKAPLGASTDEPQLIVAEVHSIMLGPDAQGEETVFPTVWAIATTTPSE